MTKTTFEDLGYIGAAIYFLSLTEGLLGMAKNEVTAQDDVAHIDVLLRDIDRLQGRLREINERTDT